MTATFTTFDVAEALGEAGAIVVAEQVERVRDMNRPPSNRVDFICYKETATWCGTIRAAQRRKVCNLIACPAAICASTWPLLRGRVWANLCTHSLLYGLALLSLGMLVDFSLLPVRSWTSCVLMT